MEPRTYLSLFLFTFLSLLLHLTVTSSFSPVDHYLIDCGSAEPTTVDLNNRRFTGDSSEFGSRVLFTNRGISLKDSNPSPISSPIYHTSRVFTRPTKYVFQIKDRGPHLVRLHFHRFDSSDFKLCNTQFHVSVNGYVLLYNYTAENTQSPTIKDYAIWVETEELVVRFIPSKRSKIAFVNAIEVISAPKDLLADVGQFVNSEKNLQIKGLLKNAIETLYRVNVGGSRVTPFNDSLWRTWTPDDEFLKSSDGSKRVYFGGRINYRNGGASREVGPDNVYNTARVISGVDDSIPKLNITWEFPVIEGCKYLVRMHFCDIASRTLGLLNFNVYINDVLAYENLDLSAMTNGMLASPFYADFVVDLGNSGVLTLRIGPSNLSVPRAPEAILNGVEIMKMNNSIGSLDGDIPAEALVRRCLQRNIDVSVPLVSGICLLLIAYAIMDRRNTRVKESVAWSPIPVDVSEDSSKHENPPSVGRV